MNPIQLPMFLIICCLLNTMGQVKELFGKTTRQTRYHFNNQCNIHSDIYSLQIRFNALEMLVSDSPIIKLKEVMNTTITIHSRFTASYNYSFQGNRTVS